MYGFISIGSNFVASTTNYIALVFQDLLPLLTVIIGLIIGFFILKEVISIIRGKEIEEDTD